MTAMTPAGDFRSSYREDMTIFPTRMQPLRAVARHRAALPRALRARPLRARPAHHHRLLRPSRRSGSTSWSASPGRSRIGHAAFFGFGAFASAWLHEYAHIPVALCIPLAGLMTALVGLVFGAPAARLKGLYLAIATLAAQFILEDFFARAQWFTGGVAGRITEPFNLFGWVARPRGELLLRRARLGGHHVRRRRQPDAHARRAGAGGGARPLPLSAEMMGINLAYYRTLSFGIASFYAGIGGALYAHYLLFVERRGVQHPLLHPVPRHGHHRRPRLASWAA